MAPVPLDQFQRRRQFRYVTEVDIDTLTFDDGLLAEELQEPRQTATWIEPPADLVGLVALPNGMLAGFRDGTNILCLCEPFHVHAWPRSTSMRWT